MLEAGDISRGLARRISELCLELLPNGVREGCEWKIGSLAGERGRSLAVHIGAGKAGVWCDFSTADAGDALALVAAVRFGGDLKAALEWSRMWLGSTAHCERRSQASPPQSSERHSQPDERRRRSAAQAMFLVSEPRLAGTPAAAYLAARGIDLAALGRQPRALRYHPSLWNGESRRAWPALVAAVTDHSGAMAAVHRTWLAQDEAGQWRKAPLQVAKASLGSVAGGTIRLWRGASGKSLASAPAGEALVIAEGIETALSVVIACPEFRVLAAVSLGNMGRINLPAAIGTIIIAADNDPPESPADRALKSAAARFVSMGKTVRIARSPVGSDMNDCLQK